jgi:putative RecB family exonuclease
MVVNTPSSPLPIRALDHLSSEMLLQIRNGVNTVLEHRNGDPVQETSAQLVVRESMELVPLPPKPAYQGSSSVFSPSQVRTFLDCSARWWFKYGLSLPEPKTSSLALGLAVHRALEINFCEKLETKEDLDTVGVVMIFRDAWREEMGRTQFGSAECPSAIGKIGEKLVAKYMDEAAGLIQPSAVELDVSGEIAGIPVRGRIDLIDDSGRIIDIKTAARKPSSVAPDHAFQLATYRQITPGASGEARVDTLVKTKTVQLVQHGYSVSEADILSTRTLFPLVKAGIQAGLYFPNRRSLLCSRRHCAFWRNCEQEFGGAVRQP